MAKIIEEKLFSVKFYHIVLVRFFWLLVILIILIVFSAEYFLIIRPKVLQTVKGGSFDIEGQKEILAEQKDYLERLKQFKVEADKLNESDLKKLDLVLAEKAEMPIILSQIDALSRQSGLRLADIDVVFGNGVITTTLGFKGGTYQTVKQYLANIEKNIRVMDITGIRVRNIGDNLSLTIENYYMNE